MYTVVNKAGSTPVNEIISTSIQKYEYTTQYTCQEMLIQKYIRNQELFRKYQDIFRNLSRNGRKLVKNR